MADDTKKTLQAQLWNIANTLRGKMGADEFRDYILGFIFYKYLSERMHLFADEILKHDGIQFDQVDDSSKKGKAMLAAIKEESLERLGYFLKPTELFHKVAEKGARKTDNFILADLGVILKHIEASTMGHESEGDFEGLFEDLDLGSSKLGKTESQKNELISKVLSHLDKIDFRLADTEADVLGDAYEYLIGQFASGAGKKAGEFYTPQEVSTILAKIVTTGKKSLKSVYDPTCGSGSLLLRVAKEVEDVGSFYGQEMNPTTYNLARMNMILHGVHYQRFDLKNEDTLEHPAPEHADLRFEAIVANPPFSADWSASAIHENDSRFSAYGRLAPKGKADFAFVQHMVHHLDNGAAMACVLPHGVLFRVGAEAHIRQYLIKDCNYLDAVIGLPANIFYGTTIPTCILVLKKQRENPEDILFIDASQGFEKVGNQNQLRPEDIERIVSTYRKRVSIGKFSKVTERSEVAETDYNLNISRYVDTFDKEIEIDLNVIVSNLIAMEKHSSEADEAIHGYCDELKIPLPQGHNASLLGFYNKGVMQQLLTQALRFKDDNGKKFPDWQELTLSELCNGEITNGVFNDPTKVGKGYRLINVSDMYRGSFIDVDVLNRVDIDPKMFEKNRVSYGDIFFTRSSLVASGIAWSNVNLSRFDDITYDGHLMRISPDLNLYDPIFLSKLMRVEAVRKQFIARGKTGTMTTIGQKDIASVSFQIPSLPEQTKIAKFLAALDRKIESVAQQVTQTQAFNKGLLQQVFV